MNKTHHTPANRDRQERDGVTLVEVLMALMIMSIGVSAVAVLFPISVLRSIEATQLTNGAIVKYNLESILDTRPQLIFDPDGDFNLSASLAARRTAIAEHFQRPASRNYIIDPVGFYTHLSDGNGGIAATFGNDGTNPLGVPRFGGGLVTTNGRKGEGVVPPFTAAGTAAELDALRLQALAFANQGDGWETQIDAIPGSLVTGGVTLSTDLDLSGVPTSGNTLPPDGSGGYLIEDPELYRIVLFSETGKFTQAFPLVAIDTASNTAFYTEDVNNNGTLDTGEDVNMTGSLDARSLPVEFRVDVDGDGTLEPGEEIVSRVLLQSRKVSDYSWMLNVRRRSDGHARRVDVVVKFNDGVSATDERVYEATFIPNSHSVWVRLPSRVTASDTTEPNIRKGKFIFDVTNGVWYRIQDVQEAPLFPTGSFVDFDYLVTVQQEIRPSDGAGTWTGVTPDGAGPFGLAMFPPGIVDVYPLGSRNLPDSMLSTAF